MSRKREITPRYFKNKGESPINFTALWEGFYSTIYMHACPLITIWPVLEIMSIRKESWNVRHMVTNQDCKVGRKSKGFHDVEWHQSSERKEKWEEYEASHHYLHGHSRMFHFKHSSLSMPHSNLLTVLFIWVCPSAQIFLKLLQGSRKGTGRDSWMGIGANLSSTWMEAKS